MTQKLCFYSDTSSKFLEYFPDKYPYIMKIQLNMNKLSTQNKTNKKYLQLK